MTGVLELEECCDNCIHQGVIVTHSHLMGGELRCMNCNNVIGTVELDDDALSEVPNRPDGYPPGVKDV